MLFILRITRKEVFRSDALATLQSTRHICDCRRDKNLKTVAISSSFVVSAVLIII
jgi:hypothetical protein